MASSRAYPKSPKSPLTQQWLAMMEDDEVDETPNTRSSATTKRKHQQSALALTKSSSHDNRSWLSFVSENPSEEMEAQSQGFHRLSIPAISAPSTTYLDGSAAFRKVRFDKSIGTKREAPPPPPILRSSTSYGGGGAASGAACIKSKKSTSLQPYRKQNQNQSAADILVDLIQESLSCRTPTTSVPSSSGILKSWEQQWERSLSFVFGGGDDDFFDDGNLQSYSEDTCSDWSGERKKGQRGGQHPFSPHSLNSLESGQSWDDVFLSQSGGEDNENDTNPLIQPVVSTDNQSGGSSSKYKGMLRRSKINKRALTPGVVPSARQPPMQSAFAPFRSRKSPSPSLLTPQPAPQSAVNVNPPSAPYLSDRSSRPPRSIPQSTVARPDSQRKTSAKDARRQQMEERIRKLQSNLKHHIAEKPVVEVSNDDSAASEDRSTKENGRPPSRGARNCTGTAARTLSTANHPPSAANYQLKKSDHSVAGALWVAAPAISGLSEESRQPNAPLVPLDDIGASRSCISAPGLFRIRRRRVPITQGGADGPPKTIVTTPHAHHKAQATIHSSHFNPLVNRVPSDDSESRSRHAYVAYFSRGNQVRASKSMRLYEHPSPPQFPTLEHEVVVRVQASTVSETDAKIRLGEYWGEGTTSRPLNLPVVPGTAFCGKLVQLDQRNSARNLGWKIGDSVISLVRVGANSRHLCIGYDRLVRMPNGVHPSSAVCLPEAYMTAFQALHIDHARSKRYSSVSLRDKSILILGGSTKVGRALIELSVAAGSRTVYATSKSDKLFPIIEQVGGIPLDKDPHHWYSLLVGKMDIVVCVDCEDMQMSELKYEHIQTLKKSGRIVLLNGPEYQGDKVVDLSRIDQHSKGTSRRLHHYNVFEAWESDIKLGKRDLEHLLDLLSKGLIEPKIFEQIPLTKVSRAQEVVLRKALAGFIVCEPWLSVDTGRKPEMQRQRQTAS